MGWILRKKQPETLGSGCQLRMVAASRSLAEAVATLPGSRIHGVSVHPPLSSGKRQPGRVRGHLLLGSTFGWLGSSPKGPSSCREQLPTTLLGREGLDLPPNPDLSPCPGHTPKHKLHKSRQSLRKCTSHHIPGPLRIGRPGSVPSQSSCRPSVCDHQHFSSLTCLETHGQKLVAWVTCGGGQLRRPQGWRGEVWPPPMGPLPASQSVLNHLGGF